MKKIILLWLLFSITIFAMARDFTYDGIVYSVVNEDHQTAKTKMGTRYVADNNVGGDITLPMKVYDENMTEFTLVEIGDCSFCNCTNLNRVSIPNTVKVIGTQAFRDCSSLTSVSISESVTDIGELAFYNCSSLETVTLWSETPLDCLRISGNRFTVFYVPMVSVEKYRAAWRDEHIIGIDSDSELNCNVLEAGSLYELVPKEQWLNITAIRIQGDINGTDLAFLNNKMVNLFELDLSEANIVEGGSGNMVTVHNTWPSDGIKSLSALKMIKLPHSLNAVEYYGFGGSNIQSITIPASLKSIGSYAFNECNRLKFVDIDNIDSWLNLEFCENGRANPLSYGAKLMVNGLLLTDLSIPSSIMQIKPHAFCNYKWLKSVRINEPVMNIGELAFENCINLESVDFTSMLSTIAYGAFLGCQSLQSVNIRSVDLIDATAFMNCYNLSCLKIDSNVNAIRGWAFWGCEALNRIYIANIVPPQVNEDPFSNYHATLYVPEGCETEYMLHSIWGKFANLQTFNPVTGSDIVKKDENAINVAIDSGVISFPNASSSMIVEIYTASGAMIYHGAPDSIALAKGVYIVRIGNIIRKIAL